MTFVLTLLFLVLMGGGLLFLLNTGRDARSRELIRVCDTLSMEYSSLAVLDMDLRTAGFEVFFRGQTRHVRNQIAGQRNGRYFKIMDYSLIGNDSVQDQTLIFIQCDSPMSGSFCISQQKVLKPDVFTDRRPTPLHRCRKELLPDWSKGWRMEAEKSHALEIMLGGPLGDWIQNHPNLELEWSENLLLVYRPDYLIDADQIQTALEAVLQLPGILTRNKKPPEGGLEKQDQD
jgi:hypothetical protein